MGVLRSAAKLAFAATDLLLGKPAGPRILIYHRVGVDSGRQMEVREDDFTWQIEWLRRHREVVSLDSALRRWEDPGSEDLVVLSFDDGYQDNYNIVFPVLSERGLPFILYLATQGIGDGDRLTWDQIGEMVSTGLVTLGAHTHRHVDLRHVSEEGVLEELETSNGLIEHHTGERPRHFAYPWGYWSAVGDAAVRWTYESAVLGSRPALGSTFFDRYMTYRYPVQLSDGRRWFEPRLRRGLRLEETIRRRLRGYEGP